ncbi:efflux transporter outer membrane subunit [Sphingomonas bacterium]|uniref:efflux transporter outer membrane subunit n=1 Tax=Sphingomonas bacterium TaxID=1895847 RepID=UPI001576178F|nr:efflux transporter outer membrane subunit [Sphingomonas bacterium]
MRKACLIAAGLLAGCTVGPNYRPPDAAVPAAFGASTDAGAIDLARPWTAFGDPVLTGLIERALRDNLDILSAAARVREARYQEIVARSAGKPMINADASLTYLRFSKNAGISQLAQSFGGGGTSGGAGSTSGGGVALPGGGIKTFALGFDASWELDLFGGDRRQVEGAVARTEASIWDARDAATMIAAEVAQAYWSLRLDQAQVAIVTDEVARQRRSLSIAENQAKVGLVPNADLTQQRTVVSSTEARAEPIRADLDLRAHQLATLLGQAPPALNAELSAPAPALQPAPAVPAGLPSDLLRRRPDVRAAERNLAASTADIGVAVADLYPRFNLTGMAQLISTALGNLFSTDSLQVNGTSALQFPILDWGRRRGTIKIREAQRDEAYLDYKSTVLQALKDVEDALVQLAAERRRHDTLARAVNDALVTAQAREAQYRTGFVAQNSLLDAQSQVLSAREQLAASDAQLRQQTVAVMKALGGGWEAADLASLEARSARGSQ